MNLLILLFGGNPLPNFITASYLCGQRDEGLRLMPVPDKILCCYSAQTKKMADGLKKVIKTLDCEDLELDHEERCFDFIRKATTKKLEKLKPDHVHLNYTGGTKVMSLAAFSSTTDYCNSNIQPTFSYLDPHHFKLMLNSSDKYPAIGDLRTCCQLNIEQLYQLHGINAPSLCQETTDLHALEKCSGLLALYESDKAFFEAWDKWPLQTQKNKVIQEIGEEDPEDLQRALLELTASTYSEMLANWPLETGLSKTNLKRWKEIAKYIQSGWLEQFLFETLRKKTDMGITDLAWNVQGRFDKTSFEVDVICIRGCQPFLFSCTTDSTKALTKHKGFEALYRGEQFGGSQCKIVQVSMCDEENVDTIQKEDMAQFDAARNMVILGRSDLHDLDNVLDHILKGQWNDV